MRPACKLIVRTSEESKFHAYTIMTKFGVEITTDLARQKRSGRKQRREPLFLAGGQKQLWGFESGPLIPPPQRRGGSVREAGGVNLELKPQLGRFIPRTRSQEKFAPGPDA